MGCFVFGIAGAELGELGLGEGAVGGEFESALEAFNGESFVACDHVAFAEAGLCVAVVGVELDVVGEDSDRVVVFLLVVEKDVAGGFEGVLGDEVLLEVGGVGSERLCAGVDDVASEAERG